MLVLYDDARARTFEPFALTRPLGEVRAGAELIRRRWEVALGRTCAGHCAAPHLAGYTEPWAPGVLMHATLAVGTVVANSRFAPSLVPTTAAADAWAWEGEIVAVRLATEVNSTEFADGSRSLEHYVRAGAVVHDLGGHWLRNVWDLVGYLAPMLTADIPLLAADLMVSRPPSHATVIGQHEVHVEGGAHVEPYVVLDATAGPILLRKGATVQSFTRLVGPAYVGEGSTVVGDRIATVSIGEVCKVHGEVSHVIFTGHANKGHDGFVGHSVLGRWVNLGAGTITSNLKNTYGTVALWTPEGVRDTGLQFLGTLFGDHVKTGIGMRLTTGCVLGAGANVFDAMPPKMVAPFSWGGGAPYAVYTLDKFLDVAERMMSRRHIELGDSARSQLRRAYARVQEPAVAQRWASKA
jgi:UDP-N-acetylglucosamine diphosphorylase/glucosamine-1-phosphate N-acetyltransferase